MRMTAPDARRYVVAVLAALVALFLRKMLTPLLGASTFGVRRSLTRGSVVAAVRQTNDGTARRAGS